jgi:hypothetical protein
MHHVGWVAGISVKSPAADKNQRSIGLEALDGPILASSQGALGATYLDDGLVEMLFQTAFQERDATGGLSNHP